MQNVELVSVSTIIQFVIWYFTISKILAFIIKMKRFPVPNVLALVRYSISECDWNACFVC